MAQELTIVLTGATGKLGRQLAVGFAAQGHRLIFPTRNVKSAVELESLCIHAGAKEVVFISVDLMSEMAVDDIQKELLKRSLFPNILVNNARNIEYLTTENGLISRKNWQGEFLLDVIAPYELTMGLVTLEGSKLKKVINVASIYGMMVPNLILYEDPNKQSPINYGVSKSALIHLTKELAVRLASKGIEVNSVSLGGVSGRVNEEFQQRYGRLCPSGRMLSDNEIFGPIGFLASEDSNGMTGHNLVVDGGWTIW
ncbi:MAG: SDR family oxidoreductase [Myxococcaceae bacterium]